MTLFPLFLTLHSFHFSKGIAIYILHTAQCAAISMQPFVKVCFAIVVTIMQ